MPEKLHLGWENFSKHQLLFLKYLYQEGQYSDVTLVSDDQTQFKVHKIVLSASSTVFKNIIDNNPTPHSLIYLRGIKSCELESILQFIYLGEARFYQERLGDFIKVAKDLEVEGISDGVESPEENEEIVDDEIAAANDLDKTVRQEDPDTKPTLYLDESSQMKDFQSTPDDIKQPRHQTPKLNLKPQSQPKPQWLVSGRLGPARARRSAVWICAKSLGDGRAECLFCRKYIGCAEGSTGNLIRHMTKYHPEDDLVKRMIQQNKEKQVYKKISKERLKNIKN